MVFIREDILSKFMSLEAAPIESLYIEQKFCKKKWLLNSSYKPNRNNISSHLNTLRKSWNVYSAEYENIVLVGDFNTEINDTFMKSFCESYESKSLVKETKMLQKSRKPLIDLIMTNFPISFQNSCALETNLSNDFHKMTVSVMKITFTKLKPKAIRCSDYKIFCHDKFKQSLVA